MEQGYLIVGLSVLASIVGMGLGSVAAVIFGAGSSRSTNLFLSFAGGVMLALVLFELIPEAIEHSGMPIAGLGVIIGVLVVLGFDKLVDKLSEARHAKVNPDCTDTHESVEELLHTETPPTAQRNMLRVGIIILCAISLHNIPVGIVMGAASHFEITLAVTIGLMLTLHNIPEGMAVSAPLLAGGLSRTRVILLAFAAGATTALGAGVGIITGEMSPIVFALALSITGGAMLYVVIVEIFPQTIFKRKDRVQIVLALAGVVSVAVLLLAFSSHHLH